MKAFEIGGAGEGGGAEGEKEEGRRGK